MINANKSPRFQVVEQSDIFVVDTHHPDCRELLEDEGLSFPWIIAYWVPWVIPPHGWYLQQWKKDRAKSLARTLNEWHELTNKGESE